MKAENRPKLEWRIRITAPSHSTQAIATVHIVTHDGEEHRIYSQVWATGRPVKGQVDDMCTALVDDLWTAIMAHIGVQGIL